ncbi:MAG: BtpA/SgcQ family protein [Planctomycetia bacterium]|nr:MAG: BtpA/SgcQ family protein [Planctomycetia bacterium]
MIPAWSNTPHVVIGMLHAPPLPGSPGFRGDSGELRERVLADAEALASGGVHGLMLENFGDSPFFPGRVPPWTVAHLTRLACEVRSRTSLPLGINVLRNDASSALAIAHAVGAEFIRVNVLCGAYVTDQGILTGVAHDLLRERRALGAESVRIMADVNVKHAAPIGAPRALADEIADTIRRGGADAVVISGTGTGRATDPEHVRHARRAAGETPVFVGSGVTAETIAEFTEAAAGSIVGTSLKQAGSPSSPVDPFRVRALMAALARG